MHALEKLNESGEKQSGGTDEKQNGAALAKPLLSKAEMALIFGKVEPIYKVHVKILDHITAMVSHWEEDRPVAKIFVDVASL